MPTASIKTSQLALVALLLVGGAAAFIAMLALPNVADAAPAPSREVIAAIAPAIGFEIPWRTMLLIVHVLGLALGFGAALFLDFYLLRHLYDRPITPSTIDTVAHGEKLAAIGLALLWASGIGFLALYYLSDPSKLDNPKLWAKLVIVVLLTLNGLVIHAFVSPRFGRRLGFPLLGGAPLREAAPALAAAAVSATGWAFAALLGMMRELNDIVPGLWIIGTWLAVVLVAFGIAARLHVRRNEATGMRGISTHRPNHRKVYGRRSAI